VRSAAATLLSLLAAVTQAQPRTLTLEEAVALARSRAPGVQVAARLVAEAEATAVGARVFLPTNPRLTADYRRIATGPFIEPFNGYNLGLSGDVEVSGAGGLRAAEAQRRVELARAELELARAQAARTVFVAYVEVQLAQRRVVETREALALSERSESAVRERQKNGVASEPDVAIVAVEAAEVRVALEEAQRRSTVARLALVAALDLPEDSALTLVSDLDDPPEPRTLEVLVARALDRRPELASLRAGLALAQSTQGRLAREAFPKLGLNLGIDGAPASQAFAFAGVSLELPVAQRNQGPRAVAAAQEQTQRTRLEAELRRLRRDVASAHASYSSRLQQLQVLSSTALPYAINSKELVEQGWRSGRFDVFRLTAALREVLRLQKARLDTLLDAWADFAQLELASGGLTP
jgi:outer membrane protein, heavy metal efflux system